ncbi:MAG: deoxyribodipyrimidine photo-lyase [Phycisphaerales bacterium]|nr:deoxyribodipyrimidine photo-lyase [Phycisphaerales bacterium]
MRVLVWLRSDLRVVDNAALRMAAQDATDGVLAAFLLQPQQWREHDWADIKVAFLLRNLRELRAALEKLRIPLLIRTVADFGKTPAAMQQLVREYACDAVYWNHEYEWNEGKRDAAVAYACGRAGVKTRAFHDQTIVPPAALQTGQGDFYSVFSPYRRAWLRHVDEHALGEVLPAPRRQPELAAEPDDLPDRVPGFNADRDRADLWPAGPKAAEKLLEDFVAARLRTYHEQRDTPAAGGTSRLSPYLALGVISPRQCAAAAREANADRLDGPHRGPTVWISELIWREFYRHVLVGFPRVSRHRPFKPDTDRLPWRQDEEVFSAWCDGRTGVPIVDAGMRQLRATGWMHNRLRMITAMYLTKDLFIDWRWGERHFMHHLIDGDLASNNGGWQWSASTGTDAAPYFRIFNPYAQSQRFDPDGAFIRAYVPELRGLSAREIHAPAELPELVRVTLDYPAPLVDHSTARAAILAAFKQLSG